MATFTPIQIDMRQMMQIESMYYNFPQVYHAVNTMHMLLTQQGFSVKGMFDGQKFRPSDIFMRNPDMMKNYLNTEIFPAIRQMILEWLLYGLTVVRCAVSEKYPGMPALVVVPPSHVSLLMYYNEYDQYKIVAYSTAPADDVLIDPFRHDERAIPFSFVSVLNKPRENGMLCSPIATSLRILQNGEALWRHRVIGSFRGVTPPFVWTREDTSGTLIGKGGTETATNVGQIIASGIVSVPLDEAQNNAIARDQMRRQMELREAEDTRREHLERDRISSSSSVFTRRTDRELNALLSSDHIRGLEATDPINNSFFAPPGQHLEAPPPIQQLQDFVELQRFISDEVNKALGLPKEEREGQRTNVNVEFTDKRLNANIAKIQESTEPLVTEVLEQLFGWAFLDQIWKVEKEKAEKAKEEGQDLATSGSDVSEESINSDDGTGYVTRKSRKRGRFTTSEREDRRLQRKTGLQLVGNNISVTVDGEGVGPGGRTDATLRNGLVDEDASEQREMKRLRAQQERQPPQIQFSYRYHPGQSFEDLERLGKYGIVEPKKLSKYMARNMGLKDSDVSPSAYVSIKKWFDPDRDLKLEKAKKAQQLASSGGDKSSSSASASATKKPKAK